MPYEEYRPINLKTQISLKRNIRVIPVDDHEIILYRNEGVSIRLRSNETELYSLVKELQKGSSLEKLLSHFAKSSNDEHSIIELLERLREFLHHPVEDPGIPPPEMERFDRLIGHFGVLEGERNTRFDHLRNLRKSHVLLIGIGSMASWIIMHLVACGVGRITAVDGDVVELSNLSRQALYIESDLGRKKIIAAKDAVNRLSSLIIFNGIDKKLNSMEETLESFKESEMITGYIDVVIQTADKPGIKITEWIAKASYLMNIPLIRGNAKAAGPFMIPGKTACPFCKWPQIMRDFSNAERILAYDESLPGYANSAAISTEIAVQGALVAHQVISFLSKAEQIYTCNKQIGIHLSNEASIKLTNFPRDPHCPACGEKP